ncbi:MAG: hypothetical protein AB8G99_15555 [Planctomycetaceae bacterium]
MMKNVRTPKLSSVFTFAILTCAICAAPQACLAQTVSNELGTDVEEPSIEGVKGLDVTTVSGKFKDPLANTVQAAIDSSRRRTLSTDVHTPWQIMHALLGLRQEFKINKRGRKVNGLEWISNGPKFEGEDWFLESEHGGRAHPYSKPYAFEGHANQSLAILSMLGLPVDHELKAGDKTITIGDMINHAKMEINDKEEVSWSLWSLSRYLPPDSTWKNKKGEVWSVDRMAQLQLRRLLSKPMMKHPCGGTHAMFALAHARNIRLQNGLPMRGIWMQVDQQIRKCIELARVQQQPNGQFSTKFFDGRATEADFDKRIASSGHVLEFLMISLPQNELNRSWVRRGIEATARDIMSNRQSYVKCAPLYHAINGLTIYIDRTQNSKPGQLAAKPVSARKSGRLKVQLLAPVEEPAPGPPTESKAADETQDAAPEEATEDADGFKVPKVVSGPSLKALNNESVKADPAKADEPVKKTAKAESGTKAK